MRRRVDANPQAGALVDLTQKGRTRALAVGAGNDDA